MVLAGLIESENAHMLELQGMWNNYLQQILGADILKPAEYDILVGNIPEILQYHSNVLLQIKKEQSKAHRDQRIGKIFLESALKMENVHHCYFSNHPKAAQVIEKHNGTLKEFMESKGARQPGFLVLVAALSQSFRRLEKYPAMLLELDRHIEESHKDRGDLQRSIEYYKQIDKSCSNIRKQKEMELEVLGGAIKGWEGKDISELGEIHHMNLVNVGVDKQPRYFVLFANTLLILTYTSETNSLVYEGKIPASGILLTNVPDKENITNAFEIAGPMLEPILVRCLTKESKDVWLNYLTRILKLNRFPSSSQSIQQVYQHNFIANQDIDDTLLDLIHKRHASLSSLILRPSQLTPQLMYSYWNSLQTFVRENQEHLAQKLNTQPSPASFQEPPMATSSSNKRQSNVQSGINKVFFAFCSSFQHLYFQQEHEIKLIRQPSQSSTFKLPNMNELFICLGHVHRHANYCPNEQGQTVTSSRLLYGNPNSPNLNHNIDNINSFASRNREEFSRPLNVKRGFLVRQDAFDFDDGDILDENQNVL